MDAVSRSALKLEIMVFRIADTFTDSLARLTGEEQKAVKTTAFDLQVNPESPSHGFHRLERARDRNFWSVRVNADIRIIAHRAEGSLLLCYVDHHDRAYDWAQRRRLETHPRTGAAQLVELRETVREIVTPAYPAEPTRLPPAQPVLFRCSDERLLGYGVPVDWLEQVRQVDEDGLLRLAVHLPAEAAEALLELATGGQPREPQAPLPGLNPFDHPDAQRRFRVMANVEELARALEYPWDRWIVFLHPEQRQWVERSYNGPTRVSGSAGTGKTIVAIHRAVHLARADLGARVLLTTYSDTLAASLKTRLRKLAADDPRLMERIEVYSLPAVGLRLYRSLIAPPTLATPQQIREQLAEASRQVGPHRFNPQFLQSEWDQVVDALKITSWEEYRSVQRSGRRTRLTESQRATLWSIFDRVQQFLSARGWITSARMFTVLAETLALRESIPFDYAVVDEAQDIGIPHIRFFAALGRDRPNALFFAGDLGQRIFQTPFSWKAHGVDIRGRSRTLKVNYRTSHQIRMQADRLLDPDVSDADGNRESRTDTVSVFNGPQPQVSSYANEAMEVAAVAEWLRSHLVAGVLPQEIGVFVRSPAQLSRAQQAATRAERPFRVLDEHPDPHPGHLCVGTMHLAKGLEFRAVAVMGCDEDVIPLQARIQTAGEPAELEEIYQTERHLLYVACTRARDHLLLTCVAPGSEFLDDFGR